jgi:hypothetical protein
MFHDCFADEIAIDFPSVEPAVERMRDAFLGERSGADADDVLCREVFVSRREAWDGLVVPIAVPVRDVCRHCGGRGEVWTEPCGECGGSGGWLRRHVVRMTVPRGVADGARFRFRVSSSEGVPVRVEVRVAITSMNRVSESE